MKLTRKQAKPIIKAAFPGYRGRKIELRFVPSVTFSGTNWGGGSRNEYRLIGANGYTTGIPTGAPWDNPSEGKTVELQPCFMVVCHSHFCGKDMGLRIYAHPSFAPKWLPERV